MRPHCLNRVLAAGALLLLAASAVGQVFFPSRRIAPSLPSSSGTSLPGNPYYWWVFTDENTNNTAMASWTDRIQSYQFVQASSASMPVNTPYGLYLTQNKFMTNATLTSFTNYTFVFICNPIGRSTSFGYLWGWSPGNGRGFALGDTTNWVTGWDGSIYIQGETMIASNLYDLTLTAQSYASVLTTTNMYVSSYVNGVNYTNRQLSDAFAVMPLERLGDDDPFDDFSTIFVKEIVVYTNQLSAAEAAQVHLYTTNKYGSHESPIIPILQYKFSEGSGTTVADSSGNGYTANLFNTPTWVTGASGSGSAVQFNGSNQYMRSASVTYGASVLTFTAWVYWDAFALATFDIMTEHGADFSTADNTFLWGSGATGADNWAVGIQSSVGGPTRFRTETFAWPSAAAWHHYAIIWDNSTTTGDITVYIDGSTVATTIDTNNKDQSGNFANAVVNFFARNGASNFGAGRIDDFRIYRGALSATQIQAIMNNPQ